MISNWSPRSVASFWLQVSARARSLSRWRPDRAGVAVFVVALLVRVLYVLLVGAGYIPRFDAGVYDGLAQSIVTLHCYCFPGHMVTAFRPPLWPVIIAGVYAIFGVDVQAAQMACAVLGAGTCVLVYLFARDLFGRRVALVAGLLAAVYAGMFIWDGWLFSESLFIFLQMAFLLAVVRLQRTRQRRWAVLGGVALGLSALARPNGALLLALLALWAGIMLVGRFVPWRVLVPRVALLAVVALAVVLPWTIRDAAVTGSILPVSTIGTTLAGAYNDMTDQPTSGLYGIWWLPPNENADFHPHTSADEVTLEQTALAWINAHPDQTRTLLLVHAEHMWVPYLYTWNDLPFEEYPQRPASQVVMGLLPWMSIPVFALAALGFALTWRKRRRELVVVYLLVALTVMENVAFYGSPRFRAPIEPFLVLLAGVTLAWLAARVAQVLAALRAHVITPAPQAASTPVSRTASRTVSRTAVGATSQAVLAVAAVANQNGTRTPQGASIESQRPQGTAPRQQHQQRQRTRQGSNSRRQGPRARRAVAARRNGRVARP